MECSHARLLLLFSGPGPKEFAADEAEALHVHLDQCRECRGLARVEQLTDAALGPVMRKVPVPGDLHERILGRLQRERRPNRWSWAAAAAVLLVSVGFGAAWMFLPMATPFDHVVFEAKHQSGSSREMVEAWFHEQGVPFVMPPGKELEYLDSWGVVVLQGRRVARLTFVKAGEGGQENAVAHVYVIPSGSFRFSADFKSKATGNSGHVELKESEDAKFFFLSIFTRGARTAFVPKNGGIG